MGKSLLTALVRLVSITPVERCQDTLILCQPVDMLACFKAVAAEICFDRSSDRKLLFTRES